jgi:hypothetical protein
LLTNAAASRGGKVYSDVREVKETGDFVGTDLMIVVANGKVTGRLREYEGVEPAAIELVGAVTDGQLTLRGTLPDGEVEVVGREEAGRFVGWVFFRLQRQTNKHALDLPRTRSAAK